MRARALSGRKCEVSKLSKAAVGVAGLVGAAFVGLTGAAAQDEGASAAGTPPAWDTLVRCAQMANEDARLACYDTAMRAAGYAPKPAEVAEERRKRFGLSIPKVNILKHQSKQEGQAAVAQNGASAAAPTASPPPVEENPNQVTVQVQQVATLQPDGRMLVITDDGQVWEQIDTTQVSSIPRAGGTMLIKRGSLGSFFCMANKYQEVRCRRMK